MDARGALSWIILCLSILSATISLFFFFLTSSTPNTVSSLDPCSFIASPPQSIGIGIDASFLLMDSGYFHTSGRFLGLDPQSTPSSSIHAETTVRFFPYYLRKTEIEGLLRLEASLIFETGGSYKLSANASQSLAQWDIDHPGTPKWTDSIRGGNWIFRLDGFWLETQNKLCMTGSGHGFSSEGNVTLLNSILKLNVAKNATVLTSLVTGTLESSDSGVKHFDPISILGFHQSEYTYTMISQANRVCSDIDFGEQLPSLALNRSICSIQRSLHAGFELMYEKTCVEQNCNPLGKGLRFMPRFVFLNAISCSYRKLQLYVTFSNTSDSQTSTRFVPGMTLVGEGFWDEEKNRLCIMACRVTNSNGSLHDSSVEDCTIGMSLRFPGSISFRDRSRFVGNIWSTKSKKHLGYFNKVAFRSLDNSFAGVPGLKYEYSETDRAGELCDIKKSSDHSTRKYVNLVSSRSMRFRMDARNSHGGIVYACFTPLFIGNKSYGVDFYDMSMTTVPDSNHRFLNVSYSIGFSRVPDTKWVANLPGFWGSCEVAGVSSEGIYDAESGKLCMVGCRHLDQSSQNLSVNSHGLDCEVFISLQLPSLGSNSGGDLKATIRSTREASDPLYFETLQLFPFDRYAWRPEGLVKSIRMKTAIAVISLVVSCVFIASQLIYVKRRHKVLPSASLRVLIILTIGHMIPIILIIEALLGLFEPGIFLAVALSLQIRLLYLAWPEGLEGRREKACA